MLSETDVTLLVKQPAEAVSDLSKRYGRFLLMRDFILEHPEECLDIFAKCVVVKCEMSFHSDRFEYIAMSSMFERIERGMAIPTYAVNIHSVTKEATAIKVTY